MVELLHWLGEACACRYRLGCAGTKVAGCWQGNGQRPFGQLLKDWGTKPGGNLHWASPALCTCLMLAEVLNSRGVKHTACGLNLAHEAAVSGLAVYQQGTGSCGAWLGEVACYRTMDRHGY